MTPRQVLASWSGWGTTTHGDTVADDIIDTLAKHGYRIVGEGQACVGGEVVRLRQPEDDSCHLWLLNDVGEVDNPTIPEWCRDHWVDEKRGDKRLYITEALR